jgi:dTDP-4-amino-4,6-dideoxygalactose transaminase
MILQSDPKANYLAHRDEIDRAIADTLASGWYILGERVREFETNFAAFLGVRHCLGLANGTDALTLALRCLLEPGDVVVTVAHTAVATIAAIELAGATPLFVDIDPETYTIDPESVEDVIRSYRGPSRIRAILPVHLYGHPADLEAICDIARRHELFVIEDSAQAHGASLRLKSGRLNSGRLKSSEYRVGAVGHLAAFSFYPTKNLGALGDGGALTTNDDGFFEKSKLLREYGWSQRYVSSIPGMNSRLDEIQAAILSVKLQYLEQENARRRELARFYHTELAESGLALPLETDDVTAVYHQYVVEHDHRDALREHLESRKIRTLVHYPVPIHQQPAYQDRYIVHRGKLPVTEKASRRILSLPMHPHITDEQAALICREILDWSSRRSV